MRQGGANGHGRVVVHTFAVTDEHVLRVVPAQLPGRGQAQERMDAERFAREREVVRHRPERVAGDEDPTPRPPESDGSGASSRT